MSSETAALWQTIFAGLNFAALLATLVVIIIYTVSTHRTQKAIDRQVTIGEKQTQELVQQRRLSILPAFTAILNHGPDRLTLFNIGNGSALNIQIESIPVKNDAVPNAKISFRRVIHVAENTGSEEAKVTNDSEPYLGRLKQNMMGGEQPLVSLKFDDIEGNHYVQKIRIGLNQDARAWCEPLPVKLSDV